MPRVTVAYTVVANGRRTAEFALRFVQSYVQFPAGYDHKLIAICNGGPPHSFIGEALTLCGAALWPRKNDPGQDLSGYIELARKFGCEMLVCCGESIFLHRAGWLTHLVDAWNRYGPGMYGFFASNLGGPHLNTTAFAVDTRILAAWNGPLLDRKDRYNFEHGPYPFWRHVQDLGQPVKLVTFDGYYGPGEWRATRNAFWQGDQSNLLAWCTHTERYRNANDATKRRWQNNADRGLPG